MSRHAPVTPPRGVLATRETGCIQISLAGPITCRAYSVGNAIRLGNVTIVIADRFAAIGIATAALILEDLAKRLRPTFQHRFPHHRRSNAITALLTLSGTQKVHDAELRARVGGCGEASLTIGDLQITVCDRDAAESVVTALATGYDEATYRFARLQPFAELKEQVADHRRTNAARRLGHIRT